MTSTPIHALLITPEAARPIALDPHHTAIADAIGCDVFTVVGLRDGIDVFVDDEGLVNGSPLNLPLTVRAPARPSGGAVRLRGRGRRRR